MVQEIIVALIFIVAVFCFVRYFWRQTRSSAGCSTSCGCETSEAVKRIKKT